MKFAIAGAGALGSRFAYQLSKAGNEVILIDRWPAHVEAIRERGLEVDFNGETDFLHLPIYFPEEVNEQVDVVIVLTKAMQLGQMLADIQAIFHEDTKVVCLLNGLGHEMVMREYVPEANLLMGSTIWTAELVAPGKVLLHGSGNLALQNFVPGEANEAAAKAVVEVMNQAGLNASYSENVKFAIWKKACVNGCANAATAILECNLGGFFSNPYTRPMVESVVREFSAAAATQGVTLEVDEISTFVIEASLKLKDHHASMYQDLIVNNRLTEVDYINGAVARIGAEHGLEMPVNNTITYLLHMKEILLGAK